jgi:hypothetical protein
MQVDCYITQDATYYSDYVCSPCAPAPNNSYIVPELLATSCNVRCQTGFFFNVSSGACESCLAAEARICPTDAHLRGGGCYGSMLPMPTYTNLAALALSNCKICTLAIPAAGTGRFLNVAPDDGSNCRVQACRVADGVTKYVSAICSGTVDSVVDDCVTSCPVGYWLKGTCSPSTTPVCTPCTTLKPGSYNVSACGVRADAVWALCGVDAVTNAFTPGFYCAGDGARQACPFFQTSIAGARTALDCFCPAGTELASDGLSCQASNCSDTRVALTAPGAGYVSTSYMALGANTHTVCQSCGGGLAYSQGDGIGEGACVCPGGYYLSNAKVCTPCPSAPGSCMGGGYYTAVPDTCWTGQTRGVSACACLMPPYAVSTGCAAVTECAAGFGLVPGLDGGSKPSSLPSGGNMYVRDRALAWDILYRHDPAQHEDDSITNGYVLGDLAVTSDLWDPDATVLQGEEHDGWGSPNNYQYAVWILAQPGAYQVYATPLPNHRAPTYDPYLHGDVWSVLLSNYADPSTLLRLAVAQWPTAQTPARIASGTSVPTEVAVVLRDDISGTLYLYRNTLKVDFDSGALGAPLWGAAGATNGVNLTGTDCVGMGHAYAVPGGSPAGTSLARRSTFYVATSSATESMVYGVRTWDASIFALRGLPPSLTAMTLIARPDGMGVNLYLAYAGSSNNNVKLVEWYATNSHGPARDELFFAGQQKIHALLPLLWPSTLLTPTFLALAEDPMGSVDTAEPILHAGQPRLRILTADTTQRTLVPVHGIPPQTRTSLLAGAGMGVGAAMLVGAGGSDLYTISVGVCAARAAGASLSMVPTYWDGAQCLTHVCVRASACDTVNGQAWDPRTLRCVCAPGYWTFAPATSTTDLMCRVCVAGYYCPGNGTSLQCPYASMTSPTGASASVDCVCRVAGQFFDTVTKRCLACAAGSWCPNQWSALPCPGNNDATTSISGMPYPTSCLCKSGYTDVRCAACPRPYICPTNTLNKISSNAFALTLAGSVHEDPCPDVLWSKLVTYLSATRIGYLTRTDQLAGRLTCTFVPAPSDRRGVAPLAVVVVQTEIADATNGLITGMPSNLLQQFFAGSPIVLGSTSAQAYSQQVANNTPAACAAGKAPTVPDATTCVCAPGFASGTTAACTQCAAGQYKAALGPGTCTACPVGATSPVGASACTSSGGGGGSGNATTTSGGGIGSTTTLIIVGSVGGGIVVVGLLVWLFMSVCSGE